MTKEQKQLIITGFLLIILVAAGYSSFSSMSKKSKSRPVKTAGEPKSAPVAEREDEETALPKKSGDDGKWGRDPFAGIDLTQEERTDTLRLKGITLGRGTGFAFINDEIVRQGDRIAGYLVAQVLKDRVLLQKGEQQLYLTFPEER